MSRIPSAPANDVSIYRETRNTTYRPGETRGTNLSLRNGCFSGMGSAVEEVELHRLKGFCRVDNPCWANALATLDGPVIQTAEQSCQAAEFLRSLQDFDFHSANRPRFDCIGGIARDA